MVSFSYVDLKGHSGVWQDYLDQIEIADSMVFATWNYLQSDPFYQNQTYLFLSADHGRHDDAHGGFQNHGDSCDGCRILPFLALGPNIRTNLTLGQEYAYAQRDLCKTIAGIFGIPAPQAEGVVMADIFEPVATGIPASATEGQAP